MDVYAEMNYDELHAELLKLLKQASRMVVWFNEDKRSMLFPALRAMKALVAQPGRRFPTSGMPSWEEECRLLGITAELVRKWKQRTASEYDIRKVLGDDKPHPRKDHAAPTNELRKLQMICQAVLDNDDRTAERIALACAEEYGF